MSLRETSLVTEPAALRFSLEVTAPVGAGPGQGSVTVTRRRLWQQVGQRGDQV